MEFEPSVIVAISSPPGTGAIALIRLSGPGSLGLVAPYFAARASGFQVEHLQGFSSALGGFLVDGEVLDEVILTVFREPRSYTGEEMVEISCHGSPFIQMEIVKALIAGGARLATPGEFTLRAFRNGKLDLAQAEAVGDLIHSTSRSAHRLAIRQLRGELSQLLAGLRQRLLRFTALLELELDFSEEDVEFADRSQLLVLASEVEGVIRNLLGSFQSGNAIKKGIPVAIVGRPNVGKSTLLNALLRDDRALVSEIPGTTRDYLEDSIVLNGYSFRFIDTAGLRHAEEVVERMGIERSYRKMEDALVVLWVTDGRQDPSALREEFGKLPAITPEQSIILVFNKIEELAPDQVAVLKGEWGSMPSVYISAKNHQGLDVLESLLFQVVGERGLSSEGQMLTNLRHFEALTHANEALARVTSGLREAVPTDFVAQDLRLVMYHLGEVSGQIVHDEVLGYIFQNFCIGK